MGVLRLDCCTIRLVETKKKYGLRIYTHGTAEKKKDYILSHPDKAELDRWNEAFIIHAGIKKELFLGERPEMNNDQVFGLSLRDLLEREQRLHLGVPILVEQ